jgi:immune inhibitor A
VLPSKDNQPYSVRIVDANGRPVRDLYGEEIPGVGILGSGDPGSVRLGETFQLLYAGLHNQWAVVRVTAPPAG